MTKFKLVWNVLFTNIYLYLKKVFHKNLFFSNIIIMEKKSRLIISKNSYVNIGKKVKIRRNTELNVSKSLLIGSNSEIAADCSIISTKTGNINIGENCFLNRNCTIVSCENITIGDGTAIGYNTIILDSDHKYVKEGPQPWNIIKSKPVIIGKNVWIGANVVILAGTTIGDNCVIAAGSVIKGNIPKSKLVIQKKTVELIDIK